MKCCRSQVTASYGGLKSQNLERNCQFLCVFVGKMTPLWGNFQNSVPKVFIASPIDVLCSNFVKLGGREIGEIVHCLPNKKTSPGSPALPTARIAPKICYGQSQTMYTQSAPDFIQIGSLSMELYPNA